MGMIAHGYSDLFQTDVIVGQPKIGIRTVQFVNCESVGK